jgi:hypothetical protein
MVLGLCAIQKLLMSSRQRHSRNHAISRRVLVGGCFSFRQNSRLALVCPHVEAEALSVVPMLVWGTQPSRMGRSTPRVSANSQRAGAGVPTGRTFLASRAAMRGSKRSTRM